MPEIHDLSASDLVEAYRSRRLSPVEVTEHLLARQERFESVVNAFMIVDHDGALASARAAEARYLAGTALGPADGVPATIKDNIALAGLPNRKGSAVTPTGSETFDAPAVARLKEAGAVILGKTTMPEFGWKGLSDSPLSGLTRNPWHTERTAGGSTSGGAVACALGVGVIHLGTDGAGSLRIPGAFTGIVGFKQSYGRVPAFPASVMGELAHLGPLARSVADAALTLFIIGQPDERDLTAWNMAMPDPCIDIDRGVKGLKIGFSPRLGYVTKIDPQVERAVADAVSVLESLGAHVEAADPGFTDPAELLNDLWFAGAALAMQAFSAEERKRMDPGMVAIAERGRRIAGPRVVEQLTIGRTALHLKMCAYHRRYDLLVTPTMPVPAIPLGADLPPPGFSGVAQWGPEWTDWSPFTYPFNITQQPAVTVPCGLTSDGLPIGLQIVGPVRQDERVLRAAHAFEVARPFARIDAPRAGR